MIAFRVSAAAALPVAWLLAWSPVALAQSGEPLRLFPPSTERPPPRRDNRWEPLPPVKDGDAVPSLRDLPPSPARKAVVEEETLEPLDRDSIGTLDAGKGLGARVWANSRREDIVDLMQRLPARFDSAVLHDLVRRLLLTGAPLPQGGGDGLSPLAVRIATLATMGAIDDAATLARAAGPRENDETLARLDLDLALLQYDLPNACKAAQAGVAAYTDVYWQKAFTFCQAQAGEVDRARMGAALMRDANQKDPAFFGLLDAMLGDDQAKIGDLNVPSPLLLAMLRAAGRPLPPLPAGNAKPALLRAVALTPSGDIDLRLDAAERAVELHALDPKRLADLYRRMPGNPGEAPPVGETAPAATPRQRAILFQAAAQETDPAARAGALRRLLGSLPDRKLYRMTLGVALPLIEPMQPGGRLAFFAEDAARALLLARERQRAAAWAAIADREAGGNSRAATAATMLAPLFALADKRPWSEDAITEWWNLMVERDAERAPKQAALVFSMLDALNQPIPQRAWALVRDAGSPRSTLPTGKAWEGLQRAAADKRRGETILDLGVAAEGDDSLTSAGFMHGAIRALIQVGLENDARALAVESAIAAGA